MSKLLAVYNAKKSKPHELLRWNSKAMYTMVAGHLVIGNGQARSLIRSLAVL